MDHKPPQHRPDIAAMQKLMSQATYRALMRHKRLGEAIAVWREGEAVSLRAQEIPLTDREEEA